MNQASAAEHSRSTQTSIDTDVSLSQKYPLDQPLSHLDGSDLRKLLHAAYDWLASHYELVNGLNVFPVPDGDTGTNMLLTLKAAWGAVSSHGGNSVESVLKAAAEGALHGSRGNSGVILGRILYGLSQGLHQQTHLSGEDLAAALRQATETAYKSVPNPVEGTILTVIREVSQVAAVVAKTTSDLRQIFAHLLAAADAAVQRTPELLPVLKTAGVVDSGGKGLYLIFEGMHRALNGLEFFSTPLPATAPTVNAPRKGERAIPPIKWGFDVQFLVEQPNRPLEQIREDVAAMGDCPLVEGDEKLVKVHVHVFDPGVALSYAVKLGFVTDVVVENMDDMALTNQLPTAAGELGEPAETATTEQAANQNTQLSEEIGLIAVAPGGGFAEIFQNLGVGAVVEGGQTMNPSTADILAAIGRLPNRRIVILPNNSNILLAAQQAAALAEQETPPRQVAVLPCKTVPQGIAAVLAFNPMAEELSRCVGQMQERLGQIDTGDVTQAVRGVEFDGVTVEVGDFIGLHDGRLVTRGSGLVEVTIALLEQMAADESELITIYYGDFIAADAAENLAEIVRNHYPEQDVELAYGGQPHYHYILSTE